uniref:Uncharacterized protein n=1 Tax=Anguilla anguilla TaxID=7936 RepID=A0A0E9STH7_ANGAN
MCSTHLVDLAGIYTLVRPGRSPIQLPNI